jgi:glycine dehydrogenase subunit 1
MTSDFEAGLRAHLPKVKILNQSYFNEFTIELPISAKSFCEEMAKRGVLAGIPLSRFYPQAEAQKMLLVSITELTSQGDQQAFFDDAKEVLK